MDALAELHQRTGIEPDVGDVPAGRLVDERLGGGSEGVAFGIQQEALEFGDEVELRIGLDEVVDQPYRQSTGCHAHPFVQEAVDDVVLAGLLGGAGLPAPDLVTGLGLQLQCHMFGHMSEPGALLQSFQETAALAA